MVFPWKQKLYVSASFWHSCLLLGWRSYFLKENICTRKIQKKQMNWVLRSKSQICLLREFDLKKWISGAWIESWKCWLAIRRFSIIDFFVDLTLQLLPLSGLLLLLYFDSMKNLSGKLMIQEPTFDRMIVVYRFVLVMKYYLFSCFKFLNENNIRSLIISLWLCFTQGSYLRE